MSDKEILVKLGADVSGLRSGMDAGAASIVAAIQRMEGSFAAMSANVKKNTDAAANDTKKMSNEMKFSFDSVASAVGKFTAAFAVLQTVLSGGKFFADAIADTMTFVGESRQLATVLGISSTEAGILAMAIDDVHSTTEAYIGAVRALTRQLLNNEEGLQKLGMQTRDANGHLLAGKEMMDSAIKTLAQYQQGTDRNVVAAQLFGRATQDAAKFLKINEAQIEATRQKAEQFGLLISGENSKAFDKYRDASKDLGDAFMGFKKVIADLLMPVLTELKNWFASEAPPAIAQFRTVMAVAVVGLDAFITGARSFISILNMMLGTIVELVSTGGKAFEKFFKGDWSGAADAVVEGWNNIKEGWKKGTADVADINNRFAERANQAFNPDKTPAAAPKPEGGFADTKSSGSTTDTRFEKMRQQFQQEIQLQKEFNDTSLDMEIDFWEAKLATVKDKTNADKKLRFQINQELYNLKKQQYAQDRALDAESISASARFAQMEVAQEEARIKEMKAKGTLSLKEALELEKQSAMQRYYIKADALAKENVLAQGNALALQKIANEQKAAAMDYFRDLEQLEINYQNNVLAEKIAGMRRDAEIAGNNLELRLSIAQQIYNEVRKLYAAESREAQDAAAEVGRVERQLLDQKRRMAQEEIALREKVAEKIVDIAKGAAQLERDLGMSTGLELLKRTAALEEERFAIQKNAAEERIALIDPMGDPEAYNKAYAAKEELAAEHAQKMIEINRNITRETNADLVGAFQNIGQGLSSALQDLMKGTTNFKQFMLNIMQTITNAFFKMFADIIAREIMTGIQKRVFEKTIATSRITAQAAIAGASGVASMAGAPFPMNLGAPEFGAAMSELSASYGTMLAAEQGFDVPAGMSPVTRLHEKEMVLPAQYADVIRSLSERGGAAAGATNVKLEVHPDAIRMTLGDWLQGELARQAAMR